MKTMITHFNIDNSTKYTVKSRGVNMTEGNFMTEKSRQRIMAEIRSLEATRPEITDRIGAARLQGGKY